VILNGIDALAVAGDLRDRSLVIELPPIPPDKKCTEREFYCELELVRPQVLGALLDAVSAALRNLDRMRLEELPRMADFAVWVAAAEEALPWEPGAFLMAYAGNRAEADEGALDNDPVAVAVRVGFPR
jgi:putative DNA primase/helicase